MSKTDALAEFADWHIDGSSLVLRLPSGVTIRPTAAEVTGSEYKGRQTVRGEVVPRRPSEALPDVRFARYPAEAIIEVTPPAPDLSRAASCVVRIVSGIRRLDAKLSLDDDQILVGREWFPLATELLQEVAGVLRVAGIETPGDLSLKQYLALRQQNSKFVSVSEEPAMAGSVSRVGVRATGPPQGLKATLYPYQQTGVDWLSRIADEGLGCILGDEMGLGKTVQVIALLLRETKLRHMPSLVIAPATLLENWRREIARFAPSLSISMHSGQGRSGFPIGAGLALVIGAVINYIISPKGNPILLFGGIALICVAILLDAMAYRGLSGGTKATAKGVGLSLGCGVAVGLFYPFVAKALTGPHHLGPYTVFFVFAFGALVSNFPMNYALMRWPVGGPPLQVKDYFEGRMSLHAWGLLGGVIWGIGTIANFVASYVPMIGPATSFSLGEGNTMISAIWGIFVWKEFHGAGKRVKSLLAIMFLFFVLGLTCIALAPVVQ